MIPDYPISVEEAQAVLTNPGAWAEMGDLATAFLAADEAYQNMASAWRIAMVAAETWQARAEAAEAKLSAVEARMKLWEDEIDEQTRASEFGIAEGLRVAMQDIRAALKGTDQ